MQTIFNRMRTKNEFFIWRDIINLNIISFERTKGMVISMILKIAIVDDNEIFRKKIETIINQNIQGKVFLKLYSKPDNLLEDVDSRFDVYILDIEMPGMNGLELSHRIRQKGRTGEIVFLTSYKKYAIQGYVARAYAYLLKEDMDRLLPGLLGNLYEVIRVRSQKCYVIETSNYLEKLTYDEIIYIYKDGKNSIFVTGNRNISQRISLESVYQKLNASEFIYVDKGKIVNIQNVKKLVKDILYMNDENEIIISRSNIKKVKLAVRTYWNEQM